MTRITSKIKIMTSRRQFDACLPITRQTKVAEAPKLARLSVQSVILHTSSKIKRLKVKVTKRINDLFGSLQVTTFWGRGNILATPAQLVKIGMPINL